MKKKLVLSILGFIIFTSVAACSQSNEETKETKETKETEEIEETSVVPQILDVKLSINPEQGNVNESVTFTAKVSYGEKEVTDADEVEFEIWRAHDENHEKIVVEHKSNGVYELVKSFSREGTYYVYAHVTAENMHYMPKKEFIVGQPSEIENNSSSTEMEDVHGQDDTSTDMDGHDMNE
ncbi:FixH family protein [Bacillus sp. V3B]|uniref:FixH family protein n=1 Tax=Bacillus sp. V3B TaxID=2804915 RepID=UPI0021096B45|nr:FixH family protein [Bacillus sp. V3B]MCQ6276609.1 FixH family protein [Bacillus sp. V3B]